MGTVKVKLFEDKNPPNRRFTAKEYEEEIKEAIIWDRYPRTFIRDKPFYKNLIPEPLVNFDLNYH